jgi:hypothetical protein
MQIGHGTCCMEMDIQHGNGYSASKWICSMGMNIQNAHGLAAWTWKCSVSSIYWDMQHGHDMQNGRFDKLWRTVTIVKCRNFVSDCFTLSPWMTWMKSARITSSHLYLQYTWTVMSGYLHSKPSPFDKQFCMANRASYLYCDRQRKQRAASLPRRKGDV